MFNKVSYRRGVIEGVILYTLGRFWRSDYPAFFPDWGYVLAPLLFLVLQFLIAPFWATRRITSTKRERLSKRFWLLRPAHGWDLLLCRPVHFACDRTGTLHI